jgi:aspartyl-tRNA synthetase
MWSGFICFAELFLPEQKIIAQSHEAMIIEICNAIQMLRHERFYFTWVMDIAFFQLNELCLTTLMGNTNKLTHRVKVDSWDDV